MEHQKPKFNIFWKTFLITTTMLLGITFIAFMLIYMLLPNFYQNHVITSYSQRINDQILALEQTTSLEDEVTLLGEIFAGGNSPFSLLDENRTILFQLRSLTSSQIIQNFGENGFQQIGSLSHFTPDDLDFDWSFDDSENDISHSGIRIEGDGAHLQFIESEDGARSILDFSMSTFNFNYTFLNLTFDYTTALNENRTLEISIPLSPLADAQVVIMNMYPFAILLSIVFALITAFIFSRWIASPIKKIQVATSK